MPAASVGAQADMRPLAECPPCLPFHWRWPANPESVPRARKVVVESLHNLLNPHGRREPPIYQPLPGGESDLADTLSLVTSELVTNAVTHAPTEDRVVEVTLWRADGMLWLAVSDCGDVFPVPPRRVPADPVAPVFPDPDDDHGRGLYLVDALADFWTVVPRPTVGKSVVAGIRLP